MPIVRNLAIVVLFLWTFIDAVVVFRYKTDRAENRDRSSLVVLMIAGPLTWVVSIGLSFGTVGSLYLLALQVAGLVLMAIGIGVRSTAIAQLGRLHTPNVAVRMDHQLKASGLYHCVRHPSYLGALIAFAGFGLALANWLSLVVILIITPAIYLYRIREEEAALASAFGEAWRDYCRHTKRLIPWLY